MRSLKMKYHAKLMPFAVSPLITEASTKGGEKIKKELQDLGRHVRKFDYGKHNWWALLLQLKLQNFWWGERSRPYDPEVVGSARSYEQWKFCKFHGGAASAS